MKELLNLRLNSLQLLTFITEVLNDLHRKTPTQHWQPLANTPNSHTNKNSGEGDTIIVELLGTTPAKSHLLRLLQQYTLSHYKTLH